MLRGLHVVVCSIGCHRWQTCSYCLNTSGYLPGFPKFLQQPMSGLSHPDSELSWCTCMALIWQAISGRVFSIWLSAKNLSHLQSLHYSLMWKNVVWCEERNLEVVFHRCGCGFSWCSGGYPSLHTGTCLGELSPQPSCLYSPMVISSGHVGDNQNF